MSALQDSFVACRDTYVSWDERQCDLHRVQNRRDLRRPSMDVPVSFTRNTTPARDECHIGSSIKCSRGTVTLTDAGRICAYFLPSRGLKLSELAPRSRAAKRSSRKSADFISRRGGGASGTGRRSKRTVANGRETCVTTRSRLRTRGWNLAALLFSPLCERCLNPGMISRFAAGYCRSLSVIRTRTR